MASSRVQIVFVMAGSGDEALKIARALVNENLAACVNIVGPVRSIYRWRGRVEDASEHLLILKIRTRMYAKVERRVKQLHSYEVPEVVAMHVANGSRDYLEWLLQSTALLKHSTMHRTTSTANR